MTTIGDLHTLVPTLLCLASHSIALMIMTIAIRIAKNLLYMPVSIYDKMYL